MALQLRFRLQDGVHGFPIARVLAVTGYATLAGESDTYFLGWLRFHGTLVPVFDLNRVVFEEPTPQTFGSRIVLVQIEAAPAQTCIGLLAAGVTDTIAGNDPAVLPFDLDLYLQMLVNLIPEAPAVSA